MPPNQVCEHCRMAGHNRATCPDLNAARDADIYELARMADEPATVSGWHALVAKLRGIIREQKDELEHAGLVEAGQYQTIRVLREELERTESYIGLLEARLSTFAVDANPRRY